MAVVCSVNRHKHAFSQAIAAIAAVD